MKKGCIIIHGLTGTPATMAPLTEELAKSGFLVRTPLLKGHGTTEKELSLTRYQDWITSVAAAYDSLRGETDEIFCAGLSLGALLTLNLALDASRPLKKIAIMGTPLTLGPLVEMLLIPLSHVPPFRQLLKYTEKDWEASVFDPMGRMIYQNSGYRHIPARSVWELKELKAGILKRLPVLNVPTLVIHSKNDKVAPPKNAGLFLRTAKNAPTTLLWLNNSGHVITLDYEKETVCKEITGFFSLP